MALEKLLDDPAKFDSLRDGIPYVSRNLGPMDDTFSAELAERLLFERGLRRPYVELWREDTPLPVHADGRSRPSGAPDGGNSPAGLADPHHVLAQMAAGATLLMQALSLYCPEVAAFCAEMAAEIDCPVVANAYLTPPHSRGLPLHYDPVGVFLRQLAGARTWKVYPPSTRRPVRRHEPGLVPAGRAPLLDVTLAPGDCLYLPRGYYHRGTTGERGSVHLTVVEGVEDRWSHVLQDVLALAVDQVESLRAQLPGTRDALDGRAAAQWEGVRRDLVRFLEGLEEEKVSALVVRRLRAYERGAPPPAAALTHLLALEP